MGKKRIKKKVWVIHINIIKPITPGIKSKSTQVNPSNLLSRSWDQDTLIKKNTKNHKVGKKVSKNKKQY